MKIQRNGSQPSRPGPAEYFTGTVRTDSSFQAEAPGRVSGAYVTLEPGARTVWHTHPLGQTLIITAGVGWAQREGAPKQEVRPGDTVWFATVETHWHGASATVALTYLAVVENLDGKNIDLLEGVSDGEYRR